jgi:two-component system NarL family sensor kinase
VTGTTTRRLVIASLASLVVALVADAVLKAKIPHTNGALDVFYQVTFLVCVPTFGIAGALIVGRQPRNAIGWLLLAIPLVAAFAFLVGDYATYALVAAPGSLPFGRAAAWVDRWAIVPTLCLFIPLFLLFPDGRVPSRRWRPVLWLVIAAPALTTLAFAVTPGPMTGAFADIAGVRVVNPLGIRAISGSVGRIALAGGFASALSAFLAGAALVARFRGRKGDERQQIKWLALVGVALLVELALAMVLGSALGESHVGGVVGDALFAAMFVTLGFGVPIACAVAVLKYRPYDLDIVVRKTLAIGVLAVFVTAVYAVIVAGIGTVIIGGGGGSFIAGGDPRRPLSAGPGPGASSGRPTGLRQACHPLRGPGGVLGEDGRDVLL